MQTSLAEKDKDFYLQDSTSEFEIEEAEVEISPEEMEDPSEEPEDLGTIDFQISSDEEDSDEREEDEEDEEDGEDEEGGDEEKKVQSIEYSEVDDEDSEEDDNEDDDENSEEDDDEDDDEDETDYEEEEMLTEPFLGHEDSEEEEDDEDDEDDEEDEEDEDHATDQAVASIFNAHIVDMTRLAYQRAQNKLLIWIFKQSKKLNTISEKERFKNLLGDEVYDALDGNDEYTDEKTLLRISKPFIKFIMFILCMCIRSSRSHLSLYFFCLW